MRRFPMALAAAVLLSTGANAATHTITGGAMTEWVMWQRSATPVADCTSTPNCSPYATIFYDNGATAPATQPGPTVGAGNPWLAALGTVGSGPYDPPPANFNTIYSGTIVTDGSGAVVGGSFTATGSIASMLNFPSGANQYPNPTPYSGQLFLDELQSVTWDLATGAITAGSLHCRKGDMGDFLAPTTMCAGQTINNFTLIAGNQGFTGTARPRASFDPNTGTLVLFHEQFTTALAAAFDIDQRMTFTLTTLDTDGDGIADGLDNCTLVANPTQLDTNGDGYGNICDADLNNDLHVTAAGDYVRMRSVLGQLSTFSALAADADMNGDGSVTAAGDYVRLRARLITDLVGPSGLHP